MCALFGGLLKKENVSYLDKIITSTLVHEQKQTNKQKRSNSV